MEVEKDVVGGGMTPAQPRLSRWAVAGVCFGVSVVILVAVAALVPAFGRVRVPSIRRTVRNDARQIAWAAQQYLIEYQAESVAFVYDPATGDVGEPLRPFVAQIAKAYAPVPERLTETGTFQLGHPEVGVLTFTAEGQVAPATSGP